MSDASSLQLLRSRLRMGSRCTGKETYELCAVGLFTGPWWMHDRIRIEVGILPDMVITTNSSVDLFQDQGQSNTYRDHTIV